jgi:hypothetical protein
MKFKKNNKFEIKNKGSRQKNGKGWGQSRKKKKKKKSSIHINNEVIK